MSEPREYLLDDGTTIYIETSDDDREHRASRSPDAQPRSLKALFARIKPVSEAAMDTLRTINSPDEIQLEFGVKMGGKAGIFFGSIDSETAFKVTLKWTNPKESTHEPGPLAG